MDLVMEALTYFMNNMRQEEFIAAFIVILGILYFIHIYSLRQEKKKLITTVYTHVKVFQKAFETVQDGILILSDRHTVVYANHAMVDLLDLDNDFQYNRLKSMPQIDIGEGWIALDAFLKSQEDSINSKMLFFPQSIVYAKEQKEIPVNFYIDILKETALENKNTQLGLRAAELQQL